MTKAIEFAKTYVTISDQEVNIIRHARESLLFDLNQTPWVKKTGSFDVTMGSWDGAEVCQLVGLFILHQLSGIIEPARLGLYRDDGLAAIDGANGPKMDKLRKELHRTFKDMGLKITVKTNITSADFLDVTFDLKSNTFQPFRKPNNQTLYVHSESNHPPLIKKNIPEMINKRLSSISSNKDIFESAKPEYQRIQVRT